MASEDEAAAPQTDELYPVEKFARAVAGLSNGKRAELRRMYLTQRYEADAIVTGLLYTADVNVASSPEAMAPWKLLAHCAAMLSGTGQNGRQSHARGKSLGSAFHAAGLSESRLLRLVSAKGGILESLIAQSLRRVAGKDTGPVNLLTLSDLLRHSDDNRGEAARLRIARDFYAAKARSEKETPNDE